MIILFTNHDMQPSWMVDLIRNHLMHTWVALSHRLGLSTEYKLVKITLTHKDGC